MARTAPTAPSAELTIGIAGPHDLVERIMLSDVGAAAGPAAAVRMVAAAYREEHEAADKVARLSPVIDAWLFASPVPLEQARQAGMLTAPATAIPLGGSALFAALLRATRQGDFDLGRATIDVLGRDEVADAFAEIGIPSEHVHVRSNAGNAAELTSFHERQWRRDRTSAAFTCLHSVQLRLAAAGIPVFGVRPTSSGIRCGLRAAALLGRNQQLEQEQLTIIVIEVPTLRDPSRRALPRSARDELRLTVHRFLVQEAQRIHASVHPLGDYGFLAAVTRGSLAGLAGSGQPFAARARAELGIDLEVGVGTGRDAAQAEAQARADLGSKPAGRSRPAARAEPGGDAGPAAAAAAVAPDPSGARPVPPLVPPPRPAASGKARPRGLDTLARLAAQLPAADAALVVDAETAGRLLRVTPRTARRLLHALVEDGLAWPLPPSRTPQPGRPRQAYRLLAEKLPPPGREPERQPGGEPGREPEREPGREPGREPEREPDVEPG